MRRMMMYGDSLTFGFDPRGTFDSRVPETIRWTNVLQERLRGDWEIVVKAWNGKEIPETPTEWSAARDTIVSCMPFQLFAVMLGTNDYLNMYEPDIEEVTNRMRRFAYNIIRMEEYQMIAPRFLLIAPPAIHTMQDEFYAKYDTTNGAFAASYRALAAELKVDFADASSWEMPVAFDGIHLSEEANRIFADRMEETVRYIGLQTDMENVLELH